MNLKFGKYEIPSYITKSIFLTVFILTIYFVRNYITDSRDLQKGFMMNLMAGFVPLAVAFILFYLFKFKVKMPKLIFWFLCFVWFLFYPNSPYMVSDLIHNAADAGTNKRWLIIDTMVFYLLSLLCMYYGFLSIKIMKYVFTNKFNSKVANFIIVFTIIMSMMGFYIGREVQKPGQPNPDVRLSSQDFITHPIQTAEAIYNSLFPISEHIVAYQMMFLIGAIQLVLLIMMSVFKDVETELIKTTV